jgi:hypothetical protein
VILAWSFGRILGVQSVPTVQAAFSSLPDSATLCLECLTRQTTHRTEEVERQLEALGASLREDYCWGVRGVRPRVRPRHVV